MKTTAIDIVHVEKMITEHQLTKQKLGGLNTIWSNRVTDMYV